MGLYSPIIDPKTEGMAAFMFQDYIHIPFTNKLKI